MKFNIITHITTACNFDCSYCDVIKDKRLMKADVFSSVVNFIKNNDDYIERFKFFG
jgi:sulfatase maturation enzyme AslB (radical SAM superfamily)